MPAGHWTPGDAPNQSRSYQHLHAGRRYRVARAFTDYDRDAHPAGEAWTFVGVSHAPYDGGTSLFVERGGQQWQIRLQWDDEQGSVLERLAEHIVEA